MSDRPAILVVDDELSVRDSLDHWFRRDGFRTGTAKDATEALKRLEEDSWDLVLLDIKMPGVDGLELQQRIHEIDPELMVVMITAYATVETAVRALKQGAFDYVTKPVDPDELSHLVHRALEQRRLKAENLQLRRKIEHMSSLERIVGDSPQMVKVCEMIRSVASSDATVLIRGESGTGKELVARAIHNLGGRANEPFIPVAFSAIPETLIETELFGHERGSFTGAAGDKEGYFERVGAGTLFLDEFGELTLNTQVKLLRVLQEREFMRVGGKKAHRLDARVVVATHRNLEEMVKAGEFREDLYYRVQVVKIEVPPLRHRKEDIPTLARCFVDRFAKSFGKQDLRITPEALQELVRYDWPGNVRELENLVQRAVILEEDGAVSRQAVRASFVTEPAASLAPRLSGSFEDQVRQFKLGLIQDALRAANGNKTLAANRLGITRAYLHRLLSRSVSRQGGGAIDDDKRDLRAS